MDANSSSTLDAVCTAIGYSSTRILQAWYAGRNLYVPRMATEEHPLSTLISYAKLRLLVARFGGVCLWVPTPAEDYRYFVERQMAEQIAHGATDAELMERHGLGDERVRQLRYELIESGWVEYAKAMPAPREGAGRNKGLEQRVAKNF